MSDRFTRREERIAYCRDRLLGAIREDLPEIDDTDDVIIAVDHDIPIDWPRVGPELRSAVESVRRGTWNGVFPISTPRYYDIHALRAAYWNPDDAGNRTDRRKRGPLSRVLPRWVFGEYFVHARQISSRRLQRLAPVLPVKSAFGGVGIYRRAALQGRSYRSTPEDRCEHVALNAGIEGLAILTDFAIPAPLEHLGHRSRKRLHHLAVRWMLQEWFWWRHRSAFRRAAAQVRPRASRKLRIRTSACRSHEYSACTRSRLGPDAR